jgi:plasmid replication initiation protein
MEKIQDIELTIKDLQKDGVFAISLVENPAIEEDFIYLNSHQIELKVVDEEKRIVVGYALIPDKKIYRNVNGKKFNIYFSADTVRQSAELYMANLKQNSVTVNHEKKIEGAGVIESWITEDEKHDKINLYGVKPIVGGWVVMMKINNDEEWQAVKRGEYKGFSIEARYDGFEQLKQSSEESPKDALIRIIQEGLSK